MARADSFRGRPAFVAVLTVTLTLEKVKLDVFTMLTLAADNLQELSVLSDVELDISDHGEAVITADMEWTMEGSRIC